MHLVILTSTVLLIVSDSSKYRSCWDEQNGFRKDKSCLDHIFTLYSTTQARLSENRDTFVCYVDLKKAFDNVNRVDLWYKLEQLFGLDGKFLKVLKGMYAEVLSCVQVNDNITDWFSVEKGLSKVASCHPCCLVCLLTI